MLEELMTGRLSARRLIPAEGAAAAAGASAGGGRGEALVLRGRPSV